MTSIVHSVAYRNGQALGEVSIGERRVRERFPMIKRLFIESGSEAAPQRGSRPDAIRSPLETMATPDQAGQAPTAPSEARSWLQKPS